MTRSNEHTTDAVEESNGQTNCRRRSVLKATGIGAALPVVGGASTAGASSAGPADGGSGPDDARPPVVHSHFGYSGTGDDEVPARLEPDETVGLHVDEELIDDSSLPELTVEIGAFHFDPVGLHVDPGSIVEFDFHTPEHTATAYHPGQGRQQRVPAGVPAISSTVNERGGFWLYRFAEEGVYDLFCAPHEWGGMGMRVVVGDDPGGVVRAPGRPPLPMTAALLGTGVPPENPDLGPPQMAPGNIVDEESVELDDLGIDLAVTLGPPTPT